MHANFSQGYIIKNISRLIIMTSS